jgi:small GTP-binding protein
MSETDRILQSDSDINEDDNDLDSNIDNYRGRKRSGAFILERDDYHALTMNLMGNKNNESNDNAEQITPKNNGLNMNNAKRSKRSLKHDLVIVNNLCSEKRKSSYVVPIVNETQSKSKSEIDEEFKLQNMENKIKRNSLTNEEEYDVYIKLLLLGDRGVGKSTTLIQFVDSLFEPNLVSTAGVDFRTKYIKVDSKLVKLQIWDTAGQERFHVITKTYYGGAHGIVLMYDTTDRDSFSNVGYWMTNISMYSGFNVETIILGNKVDTPSKQRAVSRKEGLDISDEFSVKYYETSAKTGKNIDKAFKDIVRNILRNQEKESSITNNIINNSSSLLGRRSLHSNQFYSKQKNIERKRQLLLGKQKQKKQFNLEKFCCIL